MLGAAQAGRVTFVISVTDPAGAPIGDVKVTMTGPVERTSRTERGRLVFEELRAGSYRFRFEKDGFLPLEREVAGRGTAPIDVKVTLAPVPPPPRPPAPEPPPPPPPAPDVKPIVLDMTAFIEKNYVGRTPDRTTAMACATGGSSTLIQINVAVVEHTHPDADEFIYVIAGQGSARMGERVESLGPGVFMMIPRGMPHAFAVGNKKPLVFVSTRAGDKCM